MTEEEEKKSIEYNLKQVRDSYELHGSDWAKNAINEALSLIQSQQEEIEKLKNKNKDLLRKLRNRVKEVKKLTKYSLYKNEFSRLNRQIQQLESNNKKLIEKLEEILREYEHVLASEESAINLYSEIKNIVKGEKEWQ